jgi:hypothetical protein
MLLYIHGSRFSFISLPQSLVSVIDAALVIEAKAFKTFIRIYSLFKNERLSANIKTTLHKALIRSVITYACPAWEFAADTHLLNCGACRTRFSASLEIFQGTHPPTICI